VRVEADALLVAVRRDFHLGRLIEAMIGGILCRHRTAELVIGGNLGRRCRRGRLGCNFRLRLGGGVRLAETQQARRTSAKAERKNNKGKATHIGTRNRNEQ